MADISKFIGKKTQQQCKMERFLEMIEGKSKEEIREIEIMLLRPTTIPFYNEKKDKKVANAIQQKSITVFFPSPKYIDLWEKHFKISRNIKNNTYHVDFLIELFRLLEIGKLEYDKAKGNYYVKTKSGRKRKL